MRKKIHLLQIAVGCKQLWTRTPLEPFIIFFFVFEPKIYIQMWQKIILSQTTNKVEYEYNYMIEYFLSFTFYTLCYILLSWGKMCTVVNCILYAITLLLYLSYGLVIFFQDLKISLNKRKIKTN